MNLIPITKRQLICGEKKPFQSCHASSIAKLADGSNYCVWFGGSKEGAADVNIWGSRNKDGVWSELHLLAGGELPCWNPVLFVHSNGKVTLFYKRGSVIASWQTWYMDSDDNCTSWSQPKELVPNDHGGRGPVRNKVLVLSNGRCLAPASLEDGEWRCFTDNSDDEGKTWQKSNEIFAGLKLNGFTSSKGENISVTPQSFERRGIIQPTLWESGNGNVHMLIRSSEGHIYRSDSKNYGTNWCPAYATSLPNNNSGIDLVKAEGNLFLVCNPINENWGKRYPLKLLCSCDEGASWQDIFTFEQGPGEYSYPAIIYSDHCLLVTYTYQRKNIAFWKLKLS